MMTVSLEVITSPQKVLGEILTTIMQFTVNNHLKHQYNGTVKTQQLISNTKNLIQNTAPWYHKKRGH